MKIPLVNASSEVSRVVQRVFGRINRADARRGQDEQPEAPFALVPLTDRDRALEYINYQMPPLLLVDFSAGPFDAFEVMEQIAADPWLNHGGIIALFSGAEAFQRLSSLQSTNIIVHLDHSDVDRQLGAVLEVVRSNQQILFQRALQTDLISSVSGQFELAPNVLLVPAYANLVANYLFNVGFVDAEGRQRVSLVLTEMLLNAIEHGNCGIGFKAKQEHLAKGGTIHELIDRKCRSAAVRKRRVYYRYDIHRERSVHVIRDEGKGFDWRSRLADDEVDYLAEHGRGILLAQGYTERIAYNDAGNEVTLEFEHHGSTQIPNVLRDNEIVECKKGDRVLRQGEASDFLYYVAEGEFHVLVDGRHVANLTPADVLMGEMSFLLEEIRSATVIANTPGRLIRITKEDFINIIKNQPYFGLFLSKLIAKRLHRLSRGRLS